MCSFHLRLLLVLGVGDMKVCALLLALVVVVVRLLRVCGFRLAVEVAGALVVLAVCEVTVVSALTVFGSLHLFCMVLEFVGLLLFLMAMLALSIAFVFTACSHGVSLFRAAEFTVS